MEAAKSLRRRPANYLVSKSTWRNYSIYRSSIISFTGQTVLPLSFRMEYKEIMLFCNQERTKNYKGSDAKELTSHYF